MHPIVVKHVSKTFGKGARAVRALHDVSFEIRDGEIFGLLGPNGAGKTTLINILLDLLTPDTGTIEILGQRPGPAVFSEMNLVAGGSQFHWALTPADIFTFFAKLYEIPRPKERIAELVRLLRIEHLMDRKFSWLSTGEKLRVAFVKAMLNKPRLLLMDEPTLGLDPDVARMVRKEVQRINREEGTTILLTSHYMHEVEQLCDRIGFLYKGEMVDIGEVKDVKLKHFGSYDVILTLDKEPSAAFVQEHHARAKGTKVRVVLTTEDAMSTLLAQTHQAGYRIRDIAIKKPTLEDYFVKVLGER